MHVLTLPRNSRIFACQEAAMVRVCPISEITYYLNCRLTTREYIALPRCYSRLTNCSKIMARTSLKKKFKRILRSPRQLLITGILTVLSTTLLFANKGLWRHITLRHELSERTAYLARLQNDEEKVTRDVNLLKLEDASTIERIARERYDMKKLGETIYR